MDAIFLLKLSGTLLLVAFLVYLIATSVFTISTLGQKWANRHPEEHKQKWGRAGLYITIIAALFHAGYFITRWLAQGHIPLTSMFEYMAFLSLMIILGFILIYRIYKNPSLGAFVMFAAICLLGWASVFDQTPKPIVPSLQSNWLKLHVSTTALSQGIFAVSLAAGLMYIIRVVDQRKSSRSTVMLESFLAILLMLVGFLFMSVLFSGIGYQVDFEYINQLDQVQTIEYNLPPLAGPPGGIKLSEERMDFLFETPKWMKGVDAPRKFNTLLWSFLSGTFLYVLLRLVFRKRLGAMIQPSLNDIEPALLDEITYRAIAIAYPLFTLGGLIFAMIWAEQAWGRFWGWDPKEVWALITWLFYSVYLHLRLSRGWHGEKSAWLAVIGFIIIMFNLVFVNLIIAGLHSYASLG